MQDEELKEVVKKILDGANLEEITMKTVCRQVRSFYYLDYRFFFIYRAHSSSYSSS